MTQLVLDTGGVALNLPESRKGGYQCNNVQLGETLEMASGRVVREVRGYVYTISYQYGYLTEEEKNRFIEACEKGWHQPIGCNFLLPNTDGLAYGTFTVMDFTYPKFMWSRQDAAGTEKALWGDFKVELREVNPHD